MNIDERLKLLRNTPVFWSRLGIGYDPPLRDDNGRWLIFNRDFDRYRYYHKSFYDIGVKVHSAVVPNGWFGIDDYDYTDVDAVLDSVMDIGEDFYFMPRVKVTPPIDWCKQNPEEVFVYYNGPETAGEISSFVGTLKQDILGYDAPDGYCGGASGAYVDNRPNVGGVIGLQSFTSQKWLEDAGEALRRLINHIESKPYAERIIGYHIAYGNCGETAMTGSWNPEYHHHGDYGISASKQYAKFCAQNSLPNNIIPPAELMYKQKGSILEYFRAGYPECAEYSRFNSEMNVKACEHFCKIVKEVNPDYVAGIFYGYILGQYNCSNGGHLAIDKALDSKYIDFIASPTGYYKDGPYGAGVEQTPCDSICRRKLWIAEIDNKTHLHPAQVTEKAKDFEETKTLLTREFTKNLAFDRGYWWMDLGEGCFDSPEIMDFIAKLNQISEDIKAKPGKNVSEILMVIDDESMHHATPSLAYHESFIKEYATRIKMCGTPVTFIRKADLYDMELDGFKCIFFLNCFKTDDVFEQTLRTGFAKDATFVWSYAAGYVGDTPSADNTKRVTGFEIADYDGALPCIPNADEIDFPGIYIKSAPEVKSIKKYDDGRVMIGEIKSHNGRKNILCALPLLTIDEIFDIIMEAGVCIYSAKHTTVHADSRFAAIFANEDCSFTLNIPHEGRLADVYDESEHVNSDTVELKKGKHLFVKLI